MIHRTTFALDDASTTRLKRLATRWQVSQAEVVRRSLEEAEKTQASPPDIEERIETARRLRKSLRGKISPEDWMSMVKDARR